MKKIKKIDIQNQTIMSKFNKIRARLKTKLLCFIGAISIIECDQKTKATYKEHDKFKKSLASTKDNHKKLKETHQSLREKYTLLQDSIKEKVEDKSRLRAWADRVKIVGKCDICTREEFLTAHHLWDKKTHPSLMYQDENGVCLCSECHNGFHKLYTSKSHVTPKMYEIYKVRKHNGIL